MGEERQIGDEELMDVAHDPEQARRLRQALRTMADNPSVGGALQEMAQQVLSGHIGMKDAFQTEKYTEAIGSRLAEIRQAAESRTAADREAQREQVERWQREQVEREEKERAERDGPTLPTVRSRHRGGPSHRA